MQIFPSVFLFLVMIKIFLIPTSAIVFDPVKIIKISHVSIQRVMRHASNSRKICYVKFHTVFEFIIPQTVSTFNFHLFQYILDHSLMPMFFDFFCLLCEKQLGCSLCLHAVKYLLIFQTIFFYLTALLAVRLSSC